MKHRELGNLLRISRCFDSYRRQRLKDVDLFPALHLFVSYVCRHPGCNQENLVEALCVDKTTVAHHLARLEEKGYITRRVSEEDARCRLVYPTEKATELYPRLRAAHDEFYEGLLTDLSQEDREAVIRLSEILYQNARRMV
ncbi:MAG: MarR family transcriptional regulator [Clostridia bacterium]|nr:MarR family transcriptional regulator [Clostridia bacterium]